ncbi:MAG: carbon-nitrogen hydrolase family protein [Candidatus Glassbacteria bacterium]|nr:carbon-nitrogen hydrolase family protein [Candidatus Glassbacteria bacterium]
MHPAAAAGLPAQKLTGGFSLTAVIVFLLAVFVLSAPASSAPAPGDEAIFRADSFPGGSGAGDAGWIQWSQRQETLPRFFTAAGPSLGGPGSLGIYGASNSLARGCWRKLVEGIVAGAHYSFEAFYLARGADYPRQRCFARLDWRDAKDDRVGQRVYVPENARLGQWQQVGGVFRAPEDAGSVRVELYLSHCEQATVFWDSITLARVPDPPGRKVRVATVNCRPSENKSSAGSVEEFCEVVEQAGREGCDIVCLGEGINMIGVAVGDTYARYADIAEPVPGPTTERLGELARKHRMYIVAALGEREERAVYNTAVLIDRQGRVAGKYRKVYLPEGELEDGCAPGNSFPVFDTDFGRIGMMICWDSWFVDPARALSLQGAEIIFLPVWGGNATLIRARAIENHVYLVSCGYDVESNIYDPWGELIAEAKERPGVAAADIDLDYPPACPYSWPLGDMRLNLLHARRSDVRVPELEK